MAQANLSDRAFRWVGHRGLPQRYPENSIAGIQAAIAAGAHAVEFDLQMTRDHELVLLHDFDLHRIAGVAKTIDQLTTADLARISVHEPQRLGDEFYPTPLVTLRELVTQLRPLAPVPLFVELKAEMFAYCSRPSVVAKLANLLAPISERVILISFDLPVLREAQATLACPVGWVLSRYNNEVHGRVRDEPVDYLICDYRRLPRGKTLWSGPWQWFVYDITREAQVRRCAELAVDWLETWDIETMLALDYHIGTGL